MGELAEAGWGTEFVNIAVIQAVSLRACVGVSSSTDTIYEKQLDIPNTARKFLFDQTLGAFVNTVAFVAAMAAFKRKGAKAVQRDVESNVIPLMINSWKVWPFVALANFTLVPVSRRVIVGSIVGLFWGIYLSMFAAVD